MAPLKNQGETQHRSTFEVSPSDHRTSRYTFLDDLVKPPSGVIGVVSASFTETTLLRFWVEHLAPWFDFCDPECHFANVLPEIARKPGPLRNALLTISSRHILRYQRYKGFRGGFDWKGHTFSGLDHDAAVKYHNQCIQDLLLLSMDPEHVHNVDLLAAAVVLRSDEEVDIAIDPEEDVDDKMVFLKVTGRFIEAQVPSEVLLPHTSPTAYLPDADVATDHVMTEHQTSLPRKPSDSMTMTSPTSGGTPAFASSAGTAPSQGAGLRQACFWVALRQEIYASYLKQRPIAFPLGRCEVFRSLAPATDTVWAVRMVTFCADVLEFCHGSVSSDGDVEPARLDQDRWSSLKQREKTICALLPPSFEPVYCREPLADEVFPQIWYQRAQHANSTTYIELARMMLAVYDPAPRKLGMGSAAAQRGFMTFIKKTVLRLCGIALSNRQLPPTMINAYLSIAAFGEFFQDQNEREALIGVLYLILNEHAYPVNDIIRNLREAWYGK